MATATADGIVNPHRYGSNLVSSGATYPEGLGTSLLGETLGLAREDASLVEARDQISRTPEYVLLSKLLEDDLQFRDFVNDVLSLTSEDNEGEPKVTNYALAQALELTPLSRSLMAQKWPSPRVATDGSGGIRLSWQTKSRELRAVIPGSLDRERYLYWDEGEKYGTVQNFTAASLYLWIGWQQTQDAGSR